MINLIWWKIEPSSVYELDWLNYLLSDFQVNHIVDFESNVCIDNAVIVANLSQAFFLDQGANKTYHEEYQQLRNYIKLFKNAGKKVGLFHLGDEFYRESTSFYQDLDFVFRQYYKAEDHKKYSQCYYLPIGYKTGFSQAVINRPIAERKYLWSFAGHLKGTRFDMLRSAKKIAGGTFHTTTQWNDPNSLNTQQYADLLSNSKFSLCPMGNYSVDCFRVYESLEAGAVPIIESNQISQALATLLNPQMIIRYGIRDQNFWLRNYRYWERANHNDFPCPLIYNWKNLESKIHSIDIQDSSQKIREWWKEYKKSLVQLVQLTIKDVFF